MPRDYGQRLARCRRPSAGSTRDEMLLSSVAHDLDNVEDSIRNHFCETLRFTCLLSDRSREIFVNASRVLAMEENRFAPRGNDMHVIQSTGNTNRRKLLVHFRHMCQTLPFTGRCGAYSHDVVSTMHEGSTYKSRSLANRGRRHLPISGEKKMQAVR